MAEARSRCGCNVDVAKQRKYPKFTKEPRGFSSRVPAAQRVKMLRPLPADAAGRGAGVVPDVPAGVAPDRLLLPVWVSAAV
ncbi:hypothetical protein GCM10017708_12830 [Arthrobacter citreus]